MPHTRPHTPHPIALLAGCALAACLAATLCLLALALPPRAAAAQSANAAPASPALNKQVQEALARAKANGTIAGGAAAGAAGGAGSIDGGSLSEGGSPQSLSKLTEGSTGEEEETSTTTTSSPAPANPSRGISTGVLVPILIAGGLLIGGIAFMIVRDARNVAPAGAADLAEATAARDQAIRLRKRRAKARAARKSRKRNR
jgi:hypothetical protein